MKQLQAKLGTRKKRLLSPKELKEIYLKIFVKKPSLQKVASFAEAPPLKF